MSTYFPNIPQPPDDPSNSQSSLLSNFQAIQDAQDRNHIDLTDLADSGRHDVVEMKEQAAAPAPVVTFGSFYVKDDAGVQNFYMIDEGSNIHKFTNAFTAATAGQFVLPGGLIVKWGNQAAVNNVAIAYPVAFPSSTFHVQITPERGDNVSRHIYVKSGSLTNAGFTPLTNSGSISMFWLAIGK